MEEQGNPGVTTSDESLVLLARAGDRNAFAELWQRHARSGMRVARQFTSSSDADDLVSEAYVRIYQRVLAGGGPEGAFRPYLYTTIRNLAARWGQANHSINVEDIGEFEDVVEGDDPATIALDRTLTARAFRTLPERWQSVLWYTEVEGMDPHEVAPILGISANGVAALSYRAREGLRKAWLQAHVSDATASGECRWAIERLGDYARNGLSARERQRVSEHLGTCAKCSIISEEVDEVGSHLAMVMIPLILGGTVGGLFLTSLSAPNGAMAAELVASSMPPAFHAAATAGIAAAPAVATGLTATAVSAPLVGALAIAIAVSGGIAATSAATPPPAAASVAQPYQDSGPAPSPAPAVSPSAVPDVQATSISVPDPLVGSSTSGLSGTLGSVGSSVGTVVGKVTAPLSSLLPGVSVGPGRLAVTPAPALPVAVAASLDLSGTGTPGATVKVGVPGGTTVSTVVSPQGTWAVHLSALPAGTQAVEARQTLLSLLGIDLVTVPLSVLTNSLGLPIVIGH